MQTPKKKKQAPVFQEQTSKFIFLIPSVISLMLLIYTINEKNHTNFFFALALSIVFFAKSFLMYYGKKIIITDKKIYIYIRNKKFITWTLLDDFYIVNYKSSAVGKMFNYGTLVIINKEKKMYEYFYLRDVEKTYFNIIENYEKLMKKLDPTFIVSYKDKIDEKIDRIE